MNEETSPDRARVTTKDLKQYACYQLAKPRRFRQIPLGDWKRWMRLLKALPKRQSALRDAAFTAVGLFIPELANAFLAQPATGQSPSKMFNVHLVVGVVAFFAALICFLVDCRTVGAVSVSCESLMRDMDEVAERSVLSVEESVEGE